MLGTSRCLGCVLVSLPGNDEGFALVWCESPMWRIGCLVISSGTCCERFRELVGMGCGFLLYPLPSSMQLQMGVR